MHASNSSENKIWTGLSKKLEKFSLIFSFKPSPFGTSYWSGTSYQCLLRLQNVFRKISFSVIYHLGNFDDSIQCGFWVIPKITLTSLCKLIHDAIITPASSDPLKLENVKKRGKNYKNVNIHRSKRSFKIKSIFNKL